MLAVSMGGGGTFPVPLLLQRAGKRSEDMSVDEPLTLNTWTVRSRETHGRLLNGVSGCNASQVSNGAECLLAAIKYY